MTTAEAPAANYQEADLTPRQNLQPETIQAPGAGVPLPAGYWEKFAQKRVAKLQKIADSMTRFQEAGEIGSRRYHIVLDAERLIDKNVVATYTFTDTAVIQGLCLGLTNYYGETAHPAINNVIVLNQQENTVTMHDIDDIASIATQPGAYDVKTKPKLT